TALVDMVRPDEFGIPTDVGAGGGLGIIQRGVGVPAMPVPLPLLPGGRPVPVTTAFALDAGPVPDALVVGTAPPTTAVADGSAASSKIAIASDTPLILKT